MTNNQSTFGETIRDLRTKKGEPLRVIASALNIDSTLLSKIERGKRLPTKNQLPYFAKYFNIPLDKFISQVIADKIYLDYGPSETTVQALNIAKKRMDTFLKQNNK